MTNCEPKKNQLICSTRDCRCEPKLETKYDLMKEVVDGLASMLNNLTSSINNVTTSVDEIRRFKNEKEIQPLAIILVLLLVSLLSYLIYRTATKNRQIKGDQSKPVRYSRRSMDAFNNLVYDQITA